MPEINTMGLLTDPNIVAYYRGEDVNDTKGSFNLTNNGTTTFTAARYSNGINLGTSNSSKYLSTTNNLGIDGGAITMCGWVKLLSEIGSGKYVFYQQNSTGTDTVYEAAYEYNSGTPRLVFNRSKFGTADQSHTYTLTMGTSNFYHIAITYDTTNVLSYVNGLNTGTNAASGSGGSNRSSGFQIGSDIGGGSYASALIDDVAIFSRALTAGEISTIFSGSRSLFYSQM